MSAHRYWRVKYDSSPRGFCSAATITFNDTIGGPDITQGAGGTAICGSAYSGYGPELAFDNNTTTFWSSNGAADWIGYDFGAGHTFDVIGFGFLPRGDTYANSDAIATGGLEYSDDGATWTRLFSIPPQAGWSIGDYRKFGPQPPAASTYANQFASVVVLNEGATPAAGANANQLVIISVGREYTIPKHLHGWLIPCIWGEAFYIEKGPLI